MGTHVHERMVRKIQVKPLIEAVYTHCFWHILTYYEWERIYIAGREKGVVEIWYKMLLRWEPFVHIKIVTERDSVMGAKIKTIKMYKRTPWRSLWWLFKFYVFAKRVPKEKSDAGSTNQPGGHSALGSCKHPEEPGGHADRREELSGEPPAT